MLTTVAYWVILGSWKNGNYYLGGSIGIYRVWGLGTEGLGFRA